MVIYRSASDLARSIRRRELSAVEVLEAHLAQIEARNPALNAVITLDAESARRRAREADAALDRGEVWGPLHGLPLTLKDGHSVAGMRTTAGWKPLAEHVPERDGSVAARLKGAGAIIMGKTNVPTLLGDYQCYNPIFGRTNNPWNPERTPGGSSGGAAAALAAGMTPLEVGSDVGGSIRIPSHFCGLFGLKPTEHRVSLAGHIPEPPGTPRTARAMAVIGPMARTIEDLDLAFRILAGPDPGDLDVPPVPLREVAQPALKGLQIAWSPSLPGGRVSAAIRQAVERTANLLAGEGAQVEQALPHLDYDRARTAFWTLTDTIFKAMQPPAEGQRTFTAADWLMALHERDQAAAAVERFLADHDLLLCPVAASTAIAHCKPGTPVPVDDEPLPYMDAFALSQLFSLTGHPTLTIPVGLDPDGLPIGLQLVARRWDEEHLLAVGAAVAAVTGSFQRPPGY